MQTIVLEIRSAEGGEDSKLLVSDMADIYIRSANKQNFEVKTIQ